ncbi:MAG: ATP-dependent Clp protease ATP-binding subunit ClpA [Coxiella sp. RIFCSPHIGHO2_12_FULL_42_15]|nr:MAG: ATP-dependent Clp protease ATP-binding subunit ClpA [Coxiella sp. RIFCSPHIGHO2_12_FULL_42_15]
MFSRTLESTLNHAFGQAREKRHEFITVEHLLLALIDNPEANKVLCACGANLDRLRAGLGIFIDETTPQFPVNIEREIQPTLSFQRVLQRAIYQVQNSGFNEVTGVNVLSAIFSEPESQAVYFLTQENVTRVDVMNYISQGITKEASDIQKMTHDPLPMEPGSAQEVQTDDNLIELYTENLNDKARMGRVDPLIGRQEELLRVVQVLCRRRKNNPLLVGEAGVGKTAIAEGLAQLIVEKKVPKPLQFSTVYSIDLGVLLAGTKYRGDFEKRFKSVLKTLARDERSIVFIDEIHNLVGAGSATGGTMDASNLIKPLLGSGELKCMGATTYEEYRNYIAKDNALLRRFQKIDVSEPTPADTLKILQGLKSRFERFHDVRYTNDALKRAVDLSARYLFDRRLPDKAIDVIDEAGAFMRLNSTSQSRQTITTRDIENVVAKIARVPIETIGVTEKQLLRDLPRKLKRVVFGQDKAIEALTGAIKLARAGLGDPTKPVGSFLLAGPTGVGKTEVTRQLAFEMGVELIRFDMSEYMEKHAVSRLIGAPPGYVGYEQGGLLTEAINKHPYAILLLDEIEKAHIDIYNILLQVMDYGQLTDNNGRKADFRHVMMILTTNAGAEGLERGPIGFSRVAQHGGCEQEINRIFSPEFRNRLDAVIEFNFLDPLTVNKVVDKMLRELRDQLKEKDVKLSIDSDARDWLAKEGYNRKMGARPLARLIQKKLKLPLATELLYGKLSEGKRQVKVTVVENELLVEI